MANGMRYLRSLQVPIKIFCRNIWHESRNLIFFMTQWRCVVSFSNLNALCKTQSIYILI